jgi:hypothetical protein
MFSLCCYGNARKGGGKKYYSNPVITVYENYSNLEVVNAQSSISITEMNFLLHSYMSDLMPVEYSGFLWSFTAKENISELQINGKFPDEVIPFELSGNPVYFY